VFPLPGTPCHETSLHWQMDQRIRAAIFGAIWGMFVPSEMEVSDGKKTKVEGEKAPVRGAVSL